MAAEIWTSQLHISSGTSSEDAPEIAYAERPDYRGRATRLYLLAESARSGSDQFIGELVNRTGEGFLEGQGTLTGILQRTLRERHEELLDWNRNSLPRDQATYGISCLILRDGELFLGQTGPCLVYYRRGDRIFSRRPASVGAAAPLGGPDFVAPEFTRLELEPGDWMLLITSDAAVAISEPAVAAMQQMAAEDVLPTLYPLFHTRSHISALVVAVPESTAAPAAATADSDEIEPDILAAASAGAQVPAGRSTTPTFAAEDASAIEDDRTWPEEPEEEEYRERQPLSAAVGAGLHAVSGGLANAVTSGLATVMTGGTRLSRTITRIGRREPRPDPWKEAEADDSTWTPVEAEIEITAESASVENKTDQPAQEATEALVETAGVETTAAETDEAEPAAAEPSASEMAPPGAAEEPTDDAEPAEETDPPFPPATTAAVGVGFETSAEAESTTPEAPSRGSPEAAKEKSAASDPAEMPDDSPGSGTVEFRFDPRWDVQDARSASSTIRAMTWPSNPFTPAQPQVLQRSGDLDASRVIRPLFGLRTYMPSFRRRPLPWRTAADAQDGDGFDARPSWGNVVVGLGAMLMLLGIIAGILLVPDLISDSERDNFDDSLSIARRSLTAAAITDDPLVSADELSRAQIALEEALELRPLDIAALALQQEVTTALRQANVIVWPPDLAQILDLRGDVAPPLALGGVQISEETAYLLDESGGRIFSVPLGGGDPSVIYQAGQSYALIFQFKGPVAGQAISIAGYRDSRGVSLTILDNNRHLYRYEPAEGVVALEIPNAELLGSADAITVDAGAIYLLDAEGGSIWRIAVQEDGSLGAATPTIPRSDLREATALAVSTGIFVASADGRIRRFQDGAEQPFAVHDLDRPLLVPASLAIGELSGLIYAADRGNNRIVVFNTQGELVAQIRDTLLSGVRAIIPDETNRRLYFVTADALLTSELPSILEQ